MPPKPIPLIRIAAGFIWDSDGHVVTNYHVIRGAENVLVREWVEQPQVVQRGWFLFCSCKFCCLAAACCR